MKGNEKQNEEARTVKREEKQTRETEYSTRKGGGLFVHTQDEARWGLRGSGVKCGGVGHGGVLWKVWLAWVYRVLLRIGSFSLVCVSQQRYLLQPTPFFFGESQVRNTVFFFFRNNKVFYHYVQPKRFSIG